MSYSEKPPILSGDNRADLQSLRDYLFRMSQSLGEVATASVDDPTSVSVGYTKDGKQILKSKSTAEEIRKNAAELQSLIIKSANEVKRYADSKVEEYNELYVAQSEFGTFQEGLELTITSTARGVVEEYGYQASIDSLDGAVDELKRYYNVINGEIRRGIVMDPDSGEYVLGIAISQTLNFTGQVCDITDPNHPPDDSYDYYYIASGQTFGLYTAMGWQFWINGTRRGWYNSVDGMLHVSNILVENTLQIGQRWELIGVANGTQDEYDLELRYLGG